MKWQYVLIRFNIDILVKSIVAESLMFVVFAILQVLDKKNSSIHNSVSLQELCLSRGW